MPNTSHSVVAKCLDKMAAVVLDDEVVVVAHDDERLPNDEGQPDNHVAPPRSKLTLHKPGYRGIYFLFCLEGTEFFF